MKCLNCNKEFEAKRATARYCSAKCRKLAFSGTVEKVSVPVYLTDATGNRHKVDYEGRRGDCELLKSWEAGEGASAQQALGELARKYSVINGYLGKDTKEPTAQGRRYLGLPEPHGQAITAAAIALYLVGGAL